jgi:hypothetical protein
MSFLKLMQSTFFAYTLVLPKKCDFGQEMPFFQASLTRASPLPFSTKLCPVVDHVIDT